MSRLILLSDQLQELRRYLLSFKDETCAVLFGRSVEIGGELSRIMVREIVFPDLDKYSARSPVAAELKPEVVAEVAKKARLTGESLVFVHTHPFSMNSFSSIDDRGEEVLREFLLSRLPGVRHAAMLLTPEVSIARELGNKTKLRVVGIGSRVIYGDDFSDFSLSSQFDRQIRAFGAGGQHILQSIKVGIVGLGGTGSVVLQQLAHLGVKNFVLVDPDNVEETNLNRLIGARFSDIGVPKVDVAARLARDISPSCNIDCRNETILQARTARNLANVDFIFACTDSHGSRAVLNQLAYQYLIPTIDMGVAITLLDGKITHVSGRTQLLAPGLACLTCANILNFESIRRDMLTDFERQIDPYIPGGEEPAPSVVSLNSTISSLAVTMFLNVMVGTPGEARFLNYNGINGTVRSVSSRPHPSCVVCSSRGALARGDEWKLAARNDS